MNDDFGIGDFDHIPLGGGGTITIQSQKVQSAARVLRLLFSACNVHVISAALVSFWTGLKKINHASDFRIAVLDSIFFNVQENGS